MSRLTTYLARLVGRLGTVDQAVKGLSDAVVTLETVRDKTRGLAVAKAEQAAVLTAAATGHHDEADRAHRVAEAIKGLIA